MSYESGANQPRRGYCNCGIPVAQLVSWTENNLGRRFERCKFYSANRDDGMGCKFWRWVDEGNVHWQRDLCNQLLDENKALRREVATMKLKLDSMVEEATELKVKLRFGKGQQFGGFGVKLFLSVTIILSIIFAKIFG
ncbi:hypothetical protein BVRB_7g178060 [Beta vulgaris subsp. vulgaris]|nr:hypothetical protein BVRB_7g178060 [Beta vulgaris subsp. vulgaris]